MCGVIVCFGLSPTPHSTNGIESRTLSRVWRLVRPQTSLLFFPLMAVPASPYCLCIRCHRMVMWSARLTRDCIDLRCLLALRDCIDIALPARLGTRLHWPPHHCAVCSPCAIALTLRCLLAMVRDCIGLPTKSAMIALTCALSARLLRDCTDIALSRTVCPPLW